MCEKAVNDYHFMLKFVLDWHKNQDMCEKVIDSYPYYWFVTPKLLEVVDIVDDLQKFII